MTSESKANIEQLVLDNSNDGRRIGAEGGMVTSAVVVLLVYLLYEAVFAPPASAELDAPGEGINTSSHNINPDLPNIQRRPNVKPLENDNNRINLAGLGLIDGLSESTNNKPEPPKTFSFQNNPDNADFASQSNSPATLPLNSSPNITPPLAPQETRFVGNNAVNQQSSLVDLENPRTPTPPIVEKPRPETPKTYKIIAIAQTDPQLVATSKDAESIANYDGYQSAIQESVLVVKGTADQIQAFSERLLSSSSKSINEESIVNLELENYGVDKSDINALGAGSVFLASVDDIIQISQDSGTTLMTSIQHQQAGIKESNVDLTHFTDYIEVKTSADIKYRGHSDIDHWHQDVNLTSIGLDGSTDRVHNGNIDLSIKSETENPSAAVTPATDQPALTTNNNSNAPDQSPALSNSIPSSSEPTSSDAPAMEAPPTDQPALTTSNNNNSNAPDQSPALSNSIPSSSEPTSSDAPAMEAPPTDQPALTTSNNNNSNAPDQSPALSNSIPSSSEPTSSDAPAMETPPTDQPALTTTNNNNAPDQSPALSNSISSSSESTSSDAPAMEAPPTDQPALTTSNNNNNNAPDLSPALSNSIPSSSEPSSSDAPAMEAPPTDQPALTTNNNSNAPDLSPALSNSIPSSSESSSSDAPAMEAPPTDQPALTTNNNSNAPDQSPALSNSIPSSSEPTSSDAPAMETPPTDQPALTTNNNSNAPDQSPALSNSISSSSESTSSDAPAMEAPPTDQPALTTSNNNNNNAPDLSPALSNSIPSSSESTSSDAPAMEAPPTDQPALANNNNNAPDLSPALGNSIPSSSESTSSDAPAMEAPPTDQPALANNNNNAPDLSPALGNSIPSSSEPTSSDAPAMEAPTADQPALTTSNNNNNNAPDLSPALSNSIPSSSEPTSSDAPAMEAPTADQPAPTSSSKSGQISLTDSNEQEQLDSNNKADDELISEKINQPEGDLLNPTHHIDLKGGNNSLVVDTKIGYDSQWMAAKNEDDCSTEDACETTTQDKTSSHLNLEAIAVQDYQISSGDGSDFFNLQASINPDFIENWNEQMEKLELDESGVKHNALSMKRTILNTEGGNDIVTLKGDMETSFVDLGKGNDLLLMNGGIKTSLVTMGEGNDVALIIDPPKLTGLLLGGKGLDTLSFAGTSDPININLDNQSASLKNNKNGGWGLKISSIEAATGGTNNDTLIAGKNTTWLDGGDGNDTYVLSSTNQNNSTTPTDTYSLEINLSPHDLLNNTETLVRWDKSTNKYHTQQAFIATDTTKLPADYIEGTELLPIYNLSDSLQELGISGDILNTFNSTNISPWAIITGGDSNILVSANNDYGYSSIAGLSNNSQPIQESATEATA